MNARSKVFFDTALGAGGTKMKTFQRLGIFLATLALSSTALAQSGTSQLVHNHFAFFEHLLMTLSSSSSTYQKTHFDHLGSSEDQRQLVLGAASKFYSRENILKQQANAILARSSKAEVAATLPQIRAQRNALVLAISIEMLQALDNDSLRSIQHRIEMLDAAAPKPLY